MRRGLIIVLCALAVLPRELRGQGTLLGDGSFVNLGFESANLSSSGGPAAPVPVSQALPGWTAYLGSAPTPTVIPNNSSLAGANVSILNPQWLPNPIFQGSYMVLLQAASDPSNITPTTAALGQTGQVPFGAQNMLFEAATSGMTVTFNGATLSTVVFAKAAGFNIYEAGIASYAGQTGELKFTVQQVPGIGELYLDDITFYGQAVPEPGSLALSFLGVLALAGAGRGRLFSRSI